MGAESSFLSSCELGEPLDVAAQDWSIHPGRRSDGSKVTVFVNKHKDEKDEEHIQNATRQLKILRHPTILKFFECCKHLDGTYLVTEQVQPLELTLERLSPEEICSGLFNIAEALAFLHDKGGVSHNNVCVASIYVSSQDGGWRLGGMEHVCKFEDATVSFLKQCREQRMKRAIPPEEHGEDVKTSLAPEIGHARDAYAFGVLVQEMLEHIGNLGEMTDAFNKKIERDFLNYEPKLRPKLSSLLLDPFFKNDFLEITRFLHNITIKTESEKNIFFEGLATRLYLLPQSLVATKIMPLLLTSFVIAEPFAVSMLFPHVLTPVKDSSKRDNDFDPHAVNPVLSEDLFKEYVIPILLKMFPSREIHVRHVLLQFFAGYVHLFEHTVLKDTILPLLLVGLKDANNDMVAWNLRGLADLVPFLGAGVVVGGERIKYFVEGRPKFPLNKGNSSTTSGKQNKQLTAVSGVITIPRMVPSAPPQPLPIYKTEGTEQSHQKKEEDRDSRKLERESKRQEMRLKNELRRKEQEEKRLKQQERKTSPLRISKPSDSKLSSLNSDNASESVTSEKVKDPGGLKEEANAEDSEWLDWEGEGEVFEPIEGNLSKHSENTPSSVVNDVWGESWEDGKEDWSLGATNSKTDMSMADKKESAGSVPERKKEKTALTNSLSRDGFGGLYEIPEIKLKDASISSEVDFFADMAPDLRFHSKSERDNLLKDSKTSSTMPNVSSTRTSLIPRKSEEKGLGPTGKFDAQEQEGGESGWGEEDDLDLDLEDV